MILNKIKYKYIGMTKSIAQQIKQIQDEANQKIKLLLKAEAKKKPIKLKDENPFKAMTYQTEKQREDWLESPDSTLSSGQENEE